MFGIGSTELVILLIIVLIVFGAGKLPQVGRSLGQAITEFKTSVRDPEKDEVQPPKKDTEEIK
jgi:sec-independent protein translocase protein TatA